MRRLLAIDPGYTATGWSIVLLGDRGNPEAVVRSGVIRTKPDNDLSVGESDMLRCRSIARELRDVIRIEEPACSVVETTISGQSLRALKAMALAWATAIATVALADIPLRVVTDAAGKKALGLRRGAEKPEIQAAVAALHPEWEAQGGPKYWREHTADAIAAAHAVRGELW